MMKMYFLGQYNFNKEDKTEKWLNKKIKFLSYSDENVFLVQYNLKFYENL